MRKSRNLLCILIFTVVIMATGCTGTAVDYRTVRIGLTHGKSHSFTHALERFADTVRLKSNGRYQVKIYDSGQLGGEREMQEMLTIGSLDMSLSGTVNTYEPLFALFEMPYLYQDRDHVLKVNRGPAMEYVSRSLESKGIHLFGFYENGYRHISNSIRPINKPADMSGLLIRTPENPAQIETIKALGGIATPMSFSELYTALLQGVVDGQENPLQNIWYGRLYEAQRYVAKTYHIYNSVYVITGTKFWDAISPEDKRLFRDAMEASSRWQLDYMENLDKELEGKMKDLGIEFTYPSLEAFEKSCQPAYEALYDQFGEIARDLINQIRNER